MEIYVPVVITKGALLCGHRGEARLGELKVRRGKTAPTFLCYVMAVAPSAREGPVGEPPSCDPSWGHSAVTTLLKWNLAGIGITDPWKETPARPVHSGALQTDAW